MRRIVIIRESTSGGLNHKIACNCEYAINDINAYRDWITITDPQSLLEMKNFSEVSHIIMVVSEWNGSFPYTFKKMIDQSGWPSSLKGKNIMLVGTSQTTFGNLIGISHLEHILQWIGCNVYPKKVYIPFIQSTINSDGVYKDENDRLHNTIKSFIK